MLKKKKKKGHLHSINRRFKSYVCSDNPSGTNSQRQQSNIIQFFRGSTALDGKAFYSFFFYILVHFGSVTLYNSRWRT